MRPRIGITGGIGSGKSTVAQGFAQWGCHVIDADRIARSLTLARVQMVLCSLYALLVLQPWAAAVSLGALVVPFSETSIERYWTRVKLVYGVAWLVICAWVWWFGDRAGLLAF